MTTLQIGNELGVAARSPANQYIALVATNAGANTITVAVADLYKLRAGMVIDIIAADGTVRASARTVDAAVQSNGAVTYSGADAGTIATGDRIYLTGALTANKSNINGGVSDMAGLTLNGSADSLLNMRNRLKFLNPTLYTDAHLNGLTANDMLYAIRLADAPGSI